MLKQIQDQNVFVGKADMIEDIILDWQVDRGDNLIWLRV